MSEPTSQNPPPPKSGLRRLLFAPTREESKVFQNIALNDDLRRILEWGLCVVLFVCFIFSLGRTLDSHRWSEGFIEDARTMLTVKQWQKTGIAANHFLLIPQGFSQISPSLDLESLNHHTQGMLIEGDKAKVPKQKQAFVPTGYAVVYGLLALIDIYDKSIYQGIAVLFSFGAMFFAFHFFKGFGRIFALFFCLRYVLTPGFFGYNDSLANQPFDDFFRFACLWGWIRYLDTKDVRRGILFSVLFLLLCLTSRDSVLFVGVWAVGYYYLATGEKFTQRFWPLVLAPFLALIVLFAQSVGYLGTAATVDNIGLFFTSRSAIEFVEPNAILNTLGPQIASMVRGLEGAFGLPFWGVLFLFLGTWLVQWLYFDPTRSRWINRQLILFFVAGTLFSLVFPLSGWSQSYQARQFYPFMVLLYTHLVYESLKILLGAYQAKVPSARGWMVLGIFVIFLLFGKVLYTDPLKAAIDSPPKIRMDEHQVNFSKSIGSKINGDKVVLAFKDIFPSVLVAGGVEKVHPLVEFYMGSTVLMFHSPSDLIKDMNKLSRLVKSELTIVIVYSETQSIELLDQLDSIGVFYLLSPHSMRGGVRSLSLLLMPNWSRSFNQGEKAGTEPQLVLPKNLLIPETLFLDNG